MIKDLQNNPELIKLTNRFVILPSEEVSIEELKKNMQTFNFSNNRPVSYNPKLIKKILLDDDLFNNLLEVFKNNEANYISPAIISRGDLTPTFSLTKAEFVQIANDMFKNGFLWDGSNLKKKYETINKLVSLESLKNSTEIFESIIDGKQVSFAFSELTKFLESGFLGLLVY